MSHDPVWSGADDLVPPFPQEPVFGSPEAVEQAAAAIAGLLFSNGQGEKADRLAMMARHPDGYHERHLGGWCRKAVEHQVGAGIADLVAQRDALAAEVERLRIAFHDTEHTLRQEEHLHRETAAEVERLRAEVERLAKVAELEAGIDSAARRDNLNLALQRDVLAEALLAAWQSVSAVQEHKARGLEASACRAVAASMEAALRKAGRL